MSSLDAGERVEQIVREFERAWTHGRQPDLSEYVRDSADGELIGELAHVEMELRIKAGEPARAAAYLARFPVLRSDAEMVVSLAAWEFALRVRGEPNLDRAAFAAEFPGQEQAILARLSRLRSAPVATLGPGLAREQEPLPAVRLEGFEIQRELGRGGSGIVFEARDRSLGRLVALKMLHSAAAPSDEARRRFAAEAMMAARLQDPHIVRVYAVHPEGDAPYCVMEWLDGGTLAQRLGGRPMEPRAAAELLHLLARAVQRAHDAGLIHRDLKPANILFASDGTPKIADFGLAREVDAADGMTLSGAILGTPSYMSPEQAQGRSREAGPPADVWSLGAMLYECLTGVAPFRAATISQTLLQVTHGEPVGPRELLPGLPRDLETIALKCLRKEPARRYPRAGDLADDLQRFLRGEAVRARPISVVERTLKWAKRRPAAATALAAISVAVVLLAIATALLGRANQRERQARTESESARTLAEQRTTEALHQREEAARQARTAAVTAGFLADLFHAADSVALGGVGLAPSGLDPARTPVRDILDRGRARLNERLRDQPLVRAAMLDAIGDAYRALGLLDEAEPMLLESLQLRQEQLTPDHAEVAQSLYHVAWLRQDQGRRAEAETLYRQALAVRERGDDELATAAVRLNLAWVLTNRFEHPTRDQLAEAESLLNAAIAARERLLGATHRDTALAQAALAFVRIGRGDTFGAMPLLTTAMRNLSAPGTPDRTGAALVNYAMSKAMRKNKQYARAAELHRGVMKQAEETLGPGHPFSILLLGDYAALLRELGDLDGAAVAVRRALAYSQHSPIRWHPAGVDARLDLGELERKVGRLDEAERLMREALDVARRIEAPQRERRARGALAGLLRERGRGAEAEQVLNGGK